MTVEQHENQFNKQKTPFGTLFAHLSTKLQTSKF